MVQLGIKTSTSPEQMADRLEKQGIETLEFHLVWEDLLDLESLVDKVTYVQSKGITNIVLHQPMTNGEGEWLNLGTTRNIDDIVFSTPAMVLTAQRFENVRVLIHSVYSYTEQENDYIPKQEYLDNMLKLILLFRSYGFEKYLFYENGIDIPLAYHDDDMINLFLTNNVPLCLDISHDFITARGDMEKLLKSLTVLQPLIRHYHIVDSLGLTHDGSELPFGNIDWKAVKPLLNPEATNIFEIALPNVMDCQPMVNSYHYLNNL